LRVVIPRSTVQSHHWQALRACPYSRAVPLCSFWVQLVTGLPSPPWVGCTCSSELQGKNIFLRKKFSYKIFMMQNIWSHEVRFTSSCFDRQFFQPKKEGFNRTRYGMLACHDVIPSVGVGGVHLWRWTRFNRTRVATHGCLLVHRTPGCRVFCSTQTRRDAPTVVTCVAPLRARKMGVAFEPLRSKDFGPICPCSRDADGRSAPPGSRRGGCRIHRD
jgi:hypothetical protein